MCLRGRVRLEEHDEPEFYGIKRVLRVLSEIDGDTLRKIDTVHDQKGTLFVSWVETPTRDDMGHVESAWAEEQEYLLEYTYPDGSVFEVQTGTTVRKLVQADMTVR